MFCLNGMHSCELEIENVYCRSIISATDESKRNSAIFLNFPNEGKNGGESVILEFYQQFAFVSRDLVILVSSKSLCKVIIALSACFFKCFYHEV